MFFFVLWYIVVDIFEFWRQNHKVIQTYVLLDSNHVHNELKNRLAVRNVKKSPNQEFGLGKRGLLKSFNDTKLIGLS